MPVTRERTETDELIRLPAGGSFIVTDEQGRELFRVTADGDEVRISGVAATGGSSIPAGGLTGWALLKTSDNDGEVDWGLPTAAPPNLQTVIEESGDAGAQKIYNLPQPENDSDAATKEYVDDSVAGLASPPTFLTASDSIIVSQGGATITKTDVIRLVKTATDDPEFFQIVGYFNVFISAVTDPEAAMIDIDLKAAIETLIGGSLVIPAAQTLYSVVDAMIGGTAQVLHLDRLGQLVADNRVAVMDALGASDFVRGQFSLLAQVD